MDDLVTWLQAAIAEDEHYASYVVNNDYANSNAVWFEPSSGMVDTGDGQFSACADSSISRHIIRWDPARVLAECEAKRRMIELHRPVCVYDWNPGGNCAECSFDPEYDQDVNSSAAQVRAPCPTVRLLALPYVDRPGYREEWKHQC